MKSLQSEQECFDLLSHYTLNHKDPSYIHQYIVDAHTAQTATEETKAQAVSFALIGLYLAVDLGLSGKEVQKVRFVLTSVRRKWPVFMLPLTRGSIWASDVLNFPAGPQRDLAIRNWSASVWEAYEKVHSDVKALAKKELSGCKEFRTKVL
jgi:hypothetical protein